MSKDKPFRRIPGRRRGVLRRASLWDAGDYLLSVSGTAFAERYRRFYYRDIKAIAVQNTARVGSVGALFLLALASMFLLVLAQVPMFAHFAKWLWVAPLFLMTWLVYADVARSCRVFIYTAVSSEELPGLIRRSAARRALPLILEKIRNAQGEFVPGESVASEFPAQDQTIKVQEWSALPRQALYATFLFWLVMLASAGFAFWYRDTALTPVSLTIAKTLFCVINAIAVISGIWALLKTAGIHRASALRNYLLAALAYGAIRAYALYFTFAGIKVTHGQLLETMASVHWRQGFGAIDGTLTLALGLTGLISLLSAWQQERQQPVSKGVLSSL